MPSRMGSPPWSNLPPELLELVFLRLPKRADRAFFTAVCRAWRNAARECRLPPPSPVPWLVLPDGSATSFPHGETFQLPDGVRYHTSYGEWLVLSRSDGSCFLMDHFTKATIPLPNLSSYSYYQEPVEVDEDILVDEETWMEIIMKDIHRVFVVSLVVCSTRLVAAVLTVAGFCTIALCRPGAVAWSVSAHNGCTSLSSILVFQGKLYAIESRFLCHRHLIAIDIVDENDSDEPRVSQIRCLKFRADCRIESIESHLWMRYLVESHGKLLMILREFMHQRNGIVEGSNKCQVFEADFEQLLYAEVRTLENSQALFVGQQYSRAVDVSPYDVSRDCIFFVAYPRWVLKQKTESCGVYDMKDKKVYSALPMVSWKREKAPATWIFSQGEDKLQTEVEY